MFFRRVAANSSRQYFKRLQFTSKPKSGYSNLWYLGTGLIIVPTFIYFTSPKEPLPRAKDLIKKLPKVEEVQKELLLTQEEIPAIPSNVGVDEPEEVPITDTESEKVADSKPGELLDDDEPLLKVKYVLIGSGVASFSAIKGIRKNDKDGRILMVSEETELPYQKPPMSKELWISGNQNLEFKDWSGKDASVYYKKSEFFQKQNVDLNLGKRVVAIDAENQIITLDNGHRYEYQKLLLATGSKPIKLPIASPDAKSNVSTFRELKDYVALRELADQKKKIIVVGGGFLGSELAVGLQNKGAQVEQVFPEIGNFGFVLPDYLADHCTTQVEALNVKVHSSSLVKEISNEHDKVKVTLTNGISLVADHCVVCVGAKPDVEVAKLSGFEIDKNGGILVNSELSARSNVYAAGDCISFYDPVLGRRRIEHYDHAAQSGFHAGLNMSGLQNAYKYQPMFWSDIGPNISFEAVGILNNKLKTKSFWNISENSPFDKGVVFYVDDSKIGNCLLI